VKPEAWDVHVLDSLSGIERGQLHFQSVRVCWLDPSQAAGFKVFSQAFVAKRCNHAGMIARCVVRNKSLMLLNVELIPFSIKKYSNL